MPFMVERPERAEREFTICRVGIESLAPADNRHAEGDGYPGLNPVLACRCQDGGQMDRILLLAVSAAFAAWVMLPAPAAAQCRLCTQPSASPVSDAENESIQLQVETNLSFDRLVLAGPGTGAATIRPNGSSGAEGSVMNVGVRAMVGTVLVHGVAGRTVRVELPRRIELFSLGGGRITLDDVASDLPAVPRLDAAGNLNFRIGGRLILSGNVDGQFRGDLPVTVEYQ